MDRGFTPQGLQDPTIPEPAGERGHEKSDLGAGRLIAAGIGLLVTLGIISGVMYVLFIFLVDHQRTGPSASPLAGQQQPSGAPPLLSDPRAPLVDTVQQANTQLHSYGWVDRQTNAVHLPIERAMDLIVQRGLPARTVAPGQPTAAAP